MNRPESSVAERRRVEAAAEVLKEAERRLKRSILKLGQEPEFCEYMAHLIFGRLGMGSDPSRPTAFEHQRQSARLGAAVEIATEIRLLDPAVYRRIWEAHDRRFQAEAGLRELADHDDQEKEQTDA